MVLYISTYTMCLKGTGHWPISDSLTRSIASHRRNTLSQPALDPILLVLHFKRLSTALCLLNVIKSAHAISVWAGAGVHQELGAATVTISTLSRHQLPRHIAHITHVTLHWLANRAGNESSRSFKFLKFCSDIQISCLLLPTMGYYYPFGIVS